MKFSAGLLKWFQLGVGVNNFSAWIVLGFCYAQVEKKYPEIVPASKEVTLTCFRCGTHTLLPWQEARTPYYCWDCK